MGFDIKKFSRAKFKARTEAVEVSSLALAPFFSGKKEFRVKGLTGEEMARCNAAQAKHSNILAAMEALAGSGKDKVDGIRKMLGLSGDIEADLACRIEMLYIGCSEPKLDIQLSAKIFKVAPVDGYAATNKILMLSGQGMMPGEPAASGKEATSEQPATSDTQEESACTNSDQTSSPKDT